MIKNEIKFHKNHKLLRFLILPIKNPTKEIFKIINYFHNKLKIIVIDDGSEINTHFFKKINKKVLLIRNKKNMGKGFSIKKAFRIILKKKKCEWSNYSRLRWTACN